MVTMTIVPCSHYQTKLRLLKREENEKKLWGFECQRPECGMITEVYRTMTVAGKDRVIL